MPVDRRGNLFDGEEVGQLHGEWHRRLCDATLHCSLQRRKVTLPTSYSQWTPSHPDRCPNAGPSLSRTTAAPTATCWPGSSPTSVSGRKPPTMGKRRFGSPENSSP